MYIEISFKKLGKSEIIDVSICDKIITRASLLRDQIKALLWGDKTIKQFMINNKQR